jgi:hypothetical protein
MFDFQEERFTWAQHPPFSRHNPDGAIRPLILAITKTILDIRK